MVKYILILLLHITVKYLFTYKDKIYINIYLIYYSTITIIYIIIICNIIPIFTTIIYYIFIYGNTMPTTQLSH